MSSTLAVISLFGSSFLSATLLPGNSEIVLVALLTQSRVSPELLVLAATLGNTLGGLTNVIIGRCYRRETTAGAGNGARVAATLWPGCAVAQLGAGGGRFVVRVGRLAAHALGLCRAVSVYRKGAALHRLAMITVQGIAWWQ